MKRWSRWLALLLLLSMGAVSVSSCQSQRRTKYKRHGKIPKNGKIPCPIKDC
ncbi:MAG: hypothetical protein KatS3mg033_0621 [Thermonema sp.]|uniref:hypothetical protein n=1 Tax=Thermonema sp. TaxID=2231181 RepID=UPI0021DE62FA|nr:hypothetical protein [Thermonema sp.]GIV38821.1 MAG: hypothetical protein KatS3mg033_0621 [Thermonema sp.]